MWQPADMAHEGCAVERAAGRIIRRVTADVRRVAGDLSALGDYVDLTDVELRRRKEPAEGLFVAEGEKVIRRAVAAGHPVRSLLLEEKWLPALSDLLDQVDAPVYVAEPDTLRRVTGYSVHRGALAAMSRLPLPPPLDLARTARTLAVLEDLVDHTNVGAVFRSAAGLGRRRGPGQPPVRRPALPAVGQGVDGCRLLGAVVTTRRRGRLRCRTYGRPGTRCSR